MKNHIYIAITHPIQYFVPLYQEMAKVDDLNLNVLYFTDETIKGVRDQHFGLEFKWDIPLLSGYKYRFLKNNSWKPSINNGFFGLINFEIIKILLKEPKGLVIVCGWMNVSYIITFIAARIFGHKVGLRCEAPYAKEIRRKNISYYLRVILLRQVLFKFFVDYFFYIGEQNKKFYKFHQVPDSKLFFTPYSVDNDRFSNSRSENLKYIDRIEFGIDPKDFVILFTGKLYEVKRPLDLLESFKKMKTRNKKLIIVGDGIMRSLIEEKIKEEKIENVYLVGFKNQTEIPKYYNLSDAIVMCSESETWGLSINEALNFGLVVVAYDSVGCVEDLVIKGENGFIINKGDVLGLTEALEFASENELFRISASKKSLEIVSKYSLHQVISSILASLGK